MGNLGHSRQCGAVVDGQELDWKMGALTSLPQWNDKLCFLIISSHA